MLSPLWFHAGYLPWKYAASVHSGSVEKNHLDLPILMLCDLKSITLKHSVVGPTASWVFFTLNGLMLPRVVSCCQLLPSPCDPISKLHHCWIQHTSALRPCPLWAGSLLGGQERQSSSLCQEHVSSASASRPAHARTYAMI